MPICITGMHRSGTSLVARLLNLCGVYLGQTEGMIPAGPDNPQGFWEYRSFPEINDQILAQFGGAWNYPPLVMPAHWPERPELIPIKARALNLLAEFREQLSWGWKDPRTSLTLPFWQALIPDLKVVVCLRSPLEVTQSLKQRETQGVMTDPRDQVHYPAHLWQAYYQRLQHDCPPEQMIVTHYESYFCNPRQELQRLIAFLGLDVAASDLEAAVASISNQLYRQKSNATTMATTDIPVDVVDTYLTWCQQAGPVYDQTPSAQSWRQLFPVDSTQRRNALLAIRANHPLTPLFEKSTTGLQSQLYWADSTHDFSETHTQHFLVSPQQRTLTVSTVIQAKTPLTRLRLDPFKVREPVCIVILKRLTVTAQQGETKITVFSWDDEDSHATRLTAFNMHPLNSKPHVFWATHDSPQFIIDVTCPRLRTDTITPLAYAIDFQLEFAWDWRKLEDFAPIELLENTEQLGQTKITLEQAQATNAKLQATNAKLQATLEQLQAIPTLETAKTVLLARTVGQRVKQRANKEYRRLRGLPPLEPVSTTAQHPAQPTLTFTVQPGQPGPAPHLSLILHSDHTSSALEQAALRQWLANQTCQSVDIVTWNAETGDLVSLNLNQTLGQATDLAGLPASLNSRYLCFASADLLRQPPTYLETNLLALETEGLAFTLNTAGAVASLHQKVAQGRLPGNSARPFLRQVLRTDCIAPNFTLDLSSWLANHTRPTPAGRIVRHETAHIEADEQLPFEFSLKGGPLFTLDSYVVVGESDRAPLETPHLVHPPQTVLPGVVLPAERPTVIVVMQFLAVGGAERVALDMMRYLQDKIRFVVVAVEAREASLGTTADNFRQITPFVYNLPDFLAAPLHLSFFDYLIERFQPQSLYIANGSTWIYDVLNTLKTSYPHLRTVNQVYDYQAGWINRYDKTLAAALDANIGCNQSICRAYIERGVAPEKALLIHHGVDTTEYDPARYPEEKRLALRETFGLPPDRRVVSFLSRLHPQKRPMDFVELARQFSHDSSVIFFMVGNGPLSRQVDQEIARVSLTNIVRRSFYQPSVDLFAVSDLVVLPSEYEGMPLVILEAQAMGKPVVVTEVGNTREVIETTQGGMVVPEIGHVTALRQAVQRMLDQPPPAQPMRAAVTEHYGLAKIAKQYYEAMLGEPYA